MKIWKSIKKFGKAGILTAGLCLGVSSVHAQATLPTVVSDAISLGGEQVDAVGTNGAKALVIGAGLALGWVVISFIRKAKR